MSAQGAMDDAVAAALRMHVLPDGGPLVDAGWLAARVGEPGIALVHVDEDSSGYYTAHLPQALPLDWHDELHDGTRRGPVSQPDFESLMGSKGISRDTHVVLYGTGESLYAAHAYWLFRYYGHEKVSLLDGGLQAWTRVGGRLQDAVPPLRGGAEYRSPGPDASLRVGRVEVVDHYARKPTDVLLLDCRSPAEYAGRHSHPLDLGVEHHRVGGRIPGARNLPSTRLLTRGGSFRSLPELQDLFEVSGVRDDVEVVVYGRAAPQSSLCWFGLHELLRHSRVRHYDGGWTEYGSLVDVPVERGD